MFIVNVFIVDIAVGKHLVDTATGIRKIINASF